jgi:hypothetical protein
LRGLKRADRYYTSSVLRSDGKIFDSVLIAKQISKGSFSQSKECLKHGAGENEKMEKRGEKRFTESKSIVFSPFSIKNWSARSSRVGNFSSNGMYFMANRALQPGATIYIRAENGSTPKRGQKDSGQLRTTTLAQVKWCQPVASDSFGFRFGIGVKYL